MNKKFNFGRFCLLPKKHFIDSWKWLLLCYGLIAVVIAIVLLIGANAIDSSYITQQEFQYAIKEALMTSSAIFAFLFSSLAAGSATKTMRDRSTRLAYLMLPASQLEKFCVSVVFAIPVFIIGYTVAMYIGQIFAALLFHAFFWNTEHHMVITNWLFDVFTDTDCSALNWILLTMLVNQSIYFLGGIVWGKNPFFKTTAVIAAMSFICSMIVAIAANVLFDMSNSTFGINDDFFSEETLVTVGAVSCWIIIVFNYSVAYLRQRELEVINRW